MLGNLPRIYLTGFFHVINIHHNSFNVEVICNDSLQLLFLLVGYLISSVAQSSASRSDLDARK